MLRAVLTASLAVSVVVVAAVAAQPVQRLDGSAPGSKGHENLVCGLSALDVQAPSLARGGRMSSELESLALRPLAEPTLTLPVLHRADGELLAALTAVRVQEPTLARSELRLEETSIPVRLILPPEQPRSPALHVAERETI